MAEKDSPNQPKELVEATPENMDKLESIPEIAEELASLEKDKEETKEDIDKAIKKLDVREEELAAKKKLTREEKRELQDRRALRESVENWIPKTELGELVKKGKIKDIDDILDNKKKILESEIVDTILNLDTDLIFIGQSKGKFGGGKRRAWRQTQKKTKEGNVLTFSSMAVVGDKIGHIGLGYGRAKETFPSKDKALRKAKINLTRITRGFESPAERSNPQEEPHTIPFKVEGKSGSVKITLMPAARGTGLVVGDQVKKILKLAGIKDVYSKTKGQTKTAFNVAKATMAALEKTNQEVLTE